MALLSPAAFSANYFLIVPMPVRGVVPTPEQPPAPEIAVSMNSYTLPIGVLGMPYEGFSMATLLTVSGDQVERQASAFRPGSERLSP